jgi:hypothetical protein
MATLLLQLWPRGDVPRRGPRQVRPRPADHAVPAPGQVVPQLHQPGPARITSSASFSIMGHARPQPSSAPQIPPLTHRVRTPSSMFDMTGSPENSIGACGNKNKRSHDLNYSK